MFLKGSSLYISEHNNESIARMLSHQYQTSRFAVFSTLAHSDLIQCEHALYGVVLTGIVRWNANLTLQSSLTTLSTITPSLLSHPHYFNSQLPRCTSTTMEYTSCTFHHVSRGVSHRSACILLCLLFLPLRHLHPL